MDEAIKDLLNKINFSSILSDYFNPQKMEVYIKLLTIILYSHTNNFKTELKEFYFKKHDTKDQKYIVQLNKFLKKILNNLQYCESKTSNSIKELIYINQHFLNQDLSENLNENLIEEGNKLFEFLLNSMQKKLTTNHPS